MERTLDPILTRFRSALAQLYGERLSRVVLFGSRARGDGRPDSDYDVAVFLAHPESLGAEAARLAGIETTILLDTGAVINALPFDRTTYADPSSFMVEVRRDGLDL